VHGAGGGAVVRRLDPGEWHYDAAPGEANDVTFTATDVGVDIADTGRPSAWPRTATAA
jgi:hypothetical protein